MTLWGKPMDFMCRGMALHGKPASKGSGNVVDVASVVGYGQAWLNSTFHAASTIAAWFRLLGLGKPKALDATKRLRGRFSCRRQACHGVQRSGSRSFRTTNRGCLKFARQLDSARSRRHGRDMNRRA